MQWLTLTYGSGSHQQHTDTHRHEKTRTNTSFVLDSLSPPSAMAGGTCDTGLSPGLVLISIQIPVITEYQDDDAQGEILLTNLQTDITNVGD